MYRYYVTQRKKFDEVVSVKTLKTVKCLSKILFNMNFMDLCLLRCFLILVKIRLESVTKIFMSEVILLNLRLPETIFE